MNAFARGLGVVSLALVAGACEPRAPTVYSPEAYAPRVPRGTTYRWSFDGTAPTPGTGGVSASPERVFDAMLGHWGVQPDADATSLPGVYRQDVRFGPLDAPRVLVRGLAFGDLDASVRCRVDAGAIAQGCGLVFDARDSDRYFVARADAVEGTVSLVHVTSDGEREVAHARALVTPHVWHSLAVQARGEQIVVTWDGERVIAAVDWAREGGRIGLATIADAVTSFDDLEVTAD
ncbi:MAG TPA: hypothetical protein VF765_03140 [Polyangiaceae bacterium]